MRDLAVLLLRLVVTVARLAGPGGARSVVAESVLSLAKNNSSRLADTPQQASFAVAFGCHGGSSKIA